LGKTRGLYIISVAAEILDMHPQTLRKYERAGFVEPPRMGTLRLYSEEDIQRLRLIKYFVEELGLNLAGVELALRMTSRLLALRGRLVEEGSQEGSGAATLKAIDELLLEFGLKVSEPEVSKEPEPGPAPREPSPSPRDQASFSRVRFG